MDHAALVLNAAEVSNHVATENLFHARVAERCLQSPGKPLQRLRAALAAAFAVDRIQRALDYADARIVSFFRNYGNYITPLAPQNNDVALVTRWDATLAGVWLYESRGQRDDTKDGNKYSKIAEQVLAEMGPYRAQDKLDAARRWPAPTSPAAG